MQHNIIINILESNQPPTWSLVCRPTWSLVCRPTWSLVCRPTWSLVCRPMSCIRFNVEIDLPIVTIIVCRSGVTVKLFCTVKPLYSEQSRDPKKCSLYGGVHPRGVRYVHAHMCQKCNVHMYIKTDLPNLFDF